MKITHLTVTHDQGGAAIAVTRIHQALLSAGVDSRIFVLIDANNRDQRIQVFDYRASWLQKVLRKARAKIYANDYRHYQRANLGDRSEYFSSDRSHLYDQVVKQLPASDCIHLHWISGFLDYRILCQEILKKYPAVWTLHDMNPFTGGCHYTQNCTRFHTGCGYCPLLGENRQKDASQRIFERKRQAMTNVSRKKINIIAPSNWIAKQASSSMIFAEKNIQVIPHPINLETYAPTSLMTLPELISIHQKGKKVVLFISHSAGVKRKGYRYLLQALNLLDAHPLLLLTVGGSRPEAPEAIEHIHLSHIEDAENLNQVYNVADICVVPSEQEAFGMTAQEALSAGTPVIGFNTGGCADMIQSGVNGFLVEIGDVVGLSEAIKSFFENDDVRVKMGKNAINLTLSSYSPEKIANAYIQSYQSLGVSH